MDDRAHEPGSLAPERISARLSDESDFGYSGFGRSRAAPRRAGAAMRELEAAVARAMRSRQGPQSAARYLRRCGWSVDDALNALARPESRSTDEHS